MGHWAGQLNMSEAFTTYFRLDDLDAAFLADDATMFHAFIFTAVTLPIFCRAENLGAEKPIALGFKGPIVDGLGLPHRTMRPFADFRRRCDPNADAIKIERLLRLFKEFKDAVQTRSSSAKRSNYHPAHANASVNCHARRS